ncbi:PH domain-containing protein [Mycolicibacterium fortuitum]|uniref:PH domain-containing protein n=2 Tax=Mycolicibacterium fortuitum TaxID=1766 RepID=A0AAE5ADF1_MYCFO|nr:PH domain-containing protein [Mycolicibacterium fortuitum]MDO3239331.1 PH domain-containing protein [Mycobacteroides abscessus subsp. abscessus]MBP3087101.1 PH domain-containing protein [Mycolicibacterium fortuitum]MCV7143153.1 PH domain-containing protein [Mycolicibacterium fortuitum]MDG5770918.1 PH domain-containing protein [Mycolicibacterium fortuitum]MDG5782505.1 PH domain-containing protein [Mycolicibacterium fortuitum]
MQQTHWGPPAAGVAGCGIAGLLMAIAAVTLITDPPGRVLAGIAGVGLLTFATLSWRARPKLAINQDGLTVTGWWSSRTYRRNEIRKVRITEFRRIARKVRLLEIDTVDDRLVVLTRWDLGTDPLEVLDALTQAGFVAR